MPANDDFLDLLVGDEFRYAEAGVHGIVDSIQYDDGDKPGASAGRLPPGRGGGASARALRAGRGSLRPPRGGP